MKRKGIIISIIGIIIVALSLLGITFGYYYTQIFGNENATSVKVTSAMKAVKYVELSEEVSGTVIKPGYEYIKTFAATSLSTEEEIYHIYLDEVINEFTRTQDITYTLYRKSGNNTIDTSNLSDCEEISSGIFPKTNSYIKFNEKLLTKGDSYTYALKINYLKSTEEQDIDDGKTFGFKVQLHSEIENPYKNDTGTLKKTIIDNAIKGGTDKTTFGSDVTTFTAISGKNERVLNVAPDDYGTSYYYRGNVIDNYVSFAGKIWRIVRINGDGTVRLVLDDVAKDSSGNVIKTAFNSFYNDNAHVGYMYGTTGSITYDATHENIINSTIKTKVDKWYEDNLKTNYSNYLADTLFCNDKTLAENGIGGVTTQLGYGTNSTSYSSIERLRYSTGTTSITTATPTLKCAEKANDNYSRFTTTKTTLPSGKETNDNLKYPIGLLTADEVSFAGAYKYNQTNKTYYLYNSSITSNWWLSSPYYYVSGSTAFWWCVRYSSGSLSANVVGDSYAFRPSINLKANILVGGGDGTNSNPYKIN